MGQQENKAKTSAMQALLRSLPSVASLLDNEEVREWQREFSRAAVVSCLQAAVERAREAILAGDGDESYATEVILADAEDELLHRSMPSLRHVINATGVILHTGLGRAPLCHAAIEAIVEGAAGYCNLELNLEDGGRGLRQDHVAELLVALTGAEAATVVNNNAAATLLILQTFASGREVAVSRGQLVEIGGSFRLPDIMRAGGVVLREVGTTNRTRIEDFRAAINETTALLLRVHPSNYRVVGFTEEVSIAALAELAHEHGLLAVDDLGSGALHDLSDLGLPQEPLVADSIAAGADLVCFSGDKMLGGPQSGIIVGRRELIERLNASSLMRTYRVGKLTLLALDATLRCQQDATTARREIPALAALAAPQEALAGRAQALTERLGAQLPAERFLVCSDAAYAGGGSLPGREIPSVVVQWRPQRASAARMVRALREADPPVIARIRDDAICFDLRTVQDVDFEGLVGALCEAVWEIDEDGASASDVPLGTP